MAFRELPSPPGPDRHDGRRPIPFQEFVLKAHARCNLACDYCYMYELADQGWRTVTATMRADVFEAACERIGRHLADHGLAAARVVLHGGEPLLLGGAALAGMARRLRAAAPAGCRVAVSVQTNGTLLTGPALDRLAAAGVRVGVSLDGDRQANDRHRSTAGGRSSYAAVRRGLRLLRDRPALFAGILCVVDLGNDPVPTYEALLGHAPPAIDFLLPHANWDDPPPRPADAGEAAYGDWLAAAFDRWYDAPARETRVRLFEELIHLVLGGHSRTEAVGLSPVATVVIDVSGAYEQIDTLRSAYPGAVHTGLNVFDHPLDAAMVHPDVRARQLGAAGLCDTCRACPVHRICGGGYYPHRYRAGTGFGNPSVYSADLRRLITHIAGRLRADVQRRKGRAA